MQDTYIWGSVISGAHSDDMSVLQAPSTVQSGATLSTGQEALLQGYMMDNAAAVRAAPAARPAMVQACSLLNSPHHGSPPYSLTRALKPLQAARGLSDRVRNADIGRPASCTVLQGHECHEEGWVAP